tara:strand:- start:232 stop:990 length:759 start_codon:yes stop_codon:yes gene_type:complete
MAENKKVLDISEDLDLIFSDMVQGEKFITCMLPSRGILYQDQKSKVQIRPLTFEDEKMLATGKTKNPLNEVLSRCCSDIDINNLLLMDRIALFLKLREVSFGDGFSTRITCGECEEISEVDLNISDFPVTELPEDFVEPLEIFLEEIKRKIYIKIPRIKDEDYLETIDSIHNNLWRFIDKIQIKDERFSQDKTLIAKTIENLPRKDIHKLIAKLNLTEYGYHTKFMFKCGHCNAESLMEAPFGPDFFTETSD